jgi:hypothetical protein
MKDYLTAILDAITGMSPTTLIGGLLLALLLALPMALAYAGCRRKEMEIEMEIENDAEGNGDSRAMLLVVLAMVANLIGMAVASGHIAFLHKSNRAVANASPPGGPPGSQRPPGASERRATRITRDIFEASDTNHDGLLSVDEAAMGAAVLIRAAGEGKDSVDAQALSAALQQRLTPPNRP